MRGVVGARRFEDLPYSHRCGARWDGLRTAHCGAGCCRTFAGVSHFDAHRKDGKCLDPATIGMSLLPDRAFPCWGKPEPPR
jgi:hypothetical protein